MHWLSPAVEVVFAIASVTVFVASALAIPVALVRMPSDYFVRPRVKPRLAVQVMRNIVGGFFVLIGVMMLVLPGQGVLTMLLGVAMLEIPLRDRLIRTMLGNARVRAAVDRLRHRAGQPSLVVPLLRKNGGANVCHASNARSPSS